MRDGQAPERTGKMGIGYWFGYQYQILYTAANKTDKRCSYYGNASYLENI